MKVAVVILCTNHSAFVAQAIRSVKAQTYTDYTIFVWDNNSKDNSVEVAENSLIGVHGQVIRSRLPLRASYPVGVARWLSLRYLLERDNYDYVAILDADDYWHCRKLEKQMALFEQDKGVKLVFSDCYYFDEKRGVVRDETFHSKYSPLMRDPFLGLLTRYNFMPCPTLVFEVAALRSVIGSPMHYSAAEDYDWVLKMTAKYRCAYVKEPLAYYRIHQGQLTQNVSARCTMEEIDVVKRAIHFRGLSKGEERKVLRHLVLLYMKLLGKEIWRRG